MECQIVLHIINKGLVIQSDRKANPSECYTCCCVYLFRCFLSCPRDTSQQRQSDTCAASSSDPSSSHTGTMREQDSHSTEGSDDTEVHQQTSTQPHLSPHIFTASNTLFHSGLSFSSAEVIHL